MKWYIMNDASGLGYGPYDTLDAAILDIKEWHAFSGIEEDMIVTSTACLTYHYESRPDLGKFRILDVHHPRLLRR